MMDKQFPIQGDYGENKPSSIPWWLAEIAYKSYSAQYGKSQSLERLAERGGFGREELISLIKELQQEKGK